MARDQTIFSEICVALSIVDSEDDFSLIKNLTPKDEDIRYYVALAQNENHLYRL